MDKKQAIEYAKKYKALVAEKLPLKALYLYGSYSKGTYREDSDIASMTGLLPRYGSASFRGKMPPR